MTGRALFIPSLFTVLNFFLGFFSIVQTLHGNFDAAAWFIVIAVLCDGMDGKLARLTNSETPFGLELDSLGDLVSSGLATSVLMYRAVWVELGWLGLFFSFLFLFAGGYRLARFNIIHAKEHSRGFTGLPLPVTGLTAASFWLLRIPGSGAMPHDVWMVVFFLLIVLMISAIPYDWPKPNFRGSVKRTMLSVGVLVAVLLMAIFPRWLLFPMLVLYIVLGLARWISALLRGTSPLARSS